MNIYQTLYDLVNTFVFSGAVEVGTNQELIAILVATVGTLFVIALPFAIVWRVIRLITGG